MGAVRESPASNAASESASPLTPDRASKWQLLAWIVCAAAAIFILIVGGGYLAIASLEAKITLQVIAVLILGGWLLLAVARPAWRATTPLLEVVLIVLAAYGLSALMSQRPRLSLEPMIGGIGFAIALLFLTRVLREPWFRRRATALVIGTVAVVAIGFIVQVVVEWTQWWLLLAERCQGGSVCGESIVAPPLRPRWAGLLYGTPNLVAAYLLVAGPLALALLRDSTSSRLPAVGLAAAVIVAVFLTGARSSYLALGVAALAIALMSGQGQLRRWNARAAQSVRRRRALAFVPVLAFAVAALLLPSVLHRFAQGGVTVRLDLWRAALDLFRTYPVTGGGPGTWVQLKVEANAPGSPNLIFSNAHNMYLQTAAELGVVGIIAAVVLTVAVARRLLSGRRAEDARTRHSVVAAVAGLAAFATLAIFDSLTNMPMVGLLVIGLVAWVDSDLPIDEPRPQPGSRFWQRIRGTSMLPALGLLGIAVAIPTLVRIDAAWLHSAQGGQAASTADWSVALTHYEEAQRLDPEFTLYAIQVAGAKARLGRTTESLELMSDAIKLDPVAVNIIGTAALEASLGRMSDALAHARRAVELGVRESTVALNAGLIGEAAGDTPFALDQFANAVAWNPPLASSSFWDASTRNISKDAVIDAAVRRAEPLDAALVLAYAGRTAAASEVLEGQPYSQLREIYRAVTIWRAGDPASALAHLEAMLDADPLQWRVAGWMSRIARISGYPDLAERYGRWALIVQGDSAPGVIFEAAAIPPLADLPWAGVPRSYPTGVYVRPGSPHLLMPQLTTIGLR